MDQLAALRAFVRIVETGSFTQAATILEMPKPTVTKLIQSLEAHLSTKLLSRTTRRLAVTSDGAAYYERAVQVLADIDELDSTITASQARPKGRLRIDVPSTLAQQVIIPALGAFFDRFPDIQIEVGTGDRQADLVAENVDCVIRAGALNDPALIARRIAEMHLVTCAAPAYLARHGAPAHPADLERDHLVVAYINASTRRPRPYQFVRGTETLEIHGRYRAAVNEAGPFLAAGLAGHGVIQAPDFMARASLETGTLQAVLLDWSSPAIPLHVVYPPNRHLSTKLRVFVDWAAGLFATAGLGVPAAVRRS